MIINQDFGIFNIHIYLPFAVKSGFFFVKSLFCTHLPLLLEKDIYLSWPISLNQNFAETGLEDISISFQYHEGTVQQHIQQ